MTEVMDLLIKLCQELETIKAYLHRSSKTSVETFDENWMDGQDIMQALHISKRTLQTLRTNGTLPYSRINGKFYYKVSDLENLLESNYSPAKPARHGNQ